MLDTDVFVDLLRRHEPTLQWYAGLLETPYAAGYVRMEMLEGCRDMTAVYQVRRLLRDLPIVWPSPIACQRAADDYAAQHLSHNLGLVDALIAACATEYDATLYTFNVKHYAAVSTLDVRKPYAKKA